MSRTLVTLFALVSILATGCGEVGFPDAGEVAPPPMFTSMSTSQHEQLVDSFSEVVGLGLADAVVVLDVGTTEIPTALDELAPLDAARLAAMMDTFAVPGLDLDTQVENALDDDRVLAEPVELPAGMATWYLFFGRDAVYGALFAEGSAVVVKGVSRPL